MKTGPINNQTGSTTDFLPPFFLFLLKKPHESAAFLFRGFCAGHFCEKTSC